MEGAFLFLRGRPSRYDFTEALLETLKGESEELQDNAHDVQKDKLKDSAKGKAQDLVPGKGKDSAQDIRQNSAQGKGQDLAQGKGQDSALEDVQEFEEPQSEKKKADTLPQKLEQKESTDLK